MSSATDRINIRTTVSPSDFSLYTRLSVPAGRSREALRLMRIGLKWEQFDAMPQLLLTALSGTRSSDVSNVIQSKVDHAECRAVTDKTKATASKISGNTPVSCSMMDEWGLDPVAMFITGTPVYFDESSHRVAPKKNTNDSV